MESKIKNHEKRYRLLAEKANFDFEVFHLKKSSQFCCFSQTSLKYN